jgi:hypothetical protein
MGRAYPRDRRRASKGTITKLAILVETDRGRALVDAVGAGIQEGRITTWEYESKRGFTHITPDHQWDEQAWLKPSVESPGVVLRFKCAE